MGISERRKGLRGEREVTKLLASQGWDIRNLEAQGDNLAVTPRGFLLHIETKRAERLKIPEWMRQTEHDAPNSAAPVLCFRQSKGNWYAVVDLRFLAVWL